MFALIDCNNFFVSCERAFNPKLDNKATVVLSNNDGCVISRSNEAKAIGIPMGVPLFQIEETIKRFNVHVLSPNFSLYGDMSQRVMSIAATFCPGIEIYSIDEAFLQIDSDSHKDLICFGLLIKNKIKQCTGIPISIGIAPSKTLAKIANHLAKQSKTNGIYYFQTLKQIENTLKNFPAPEIWGIGRKLAPKLQALNIYTAYDLMRASSKLLRRRFNVMMERMVYELQGISCLPLEELAPKQHIQYTRSFGRPVSQLSELKEAISSYAAHACAKLRTQHSTTQVICVYLRTSFYKGQTGYYSNHKTQGLTHPTNDTRTVIKYANQLIEELYQPGFKYHKCGIILMALAPARVQQMNLLPNNDTTTNVELMKVLDQINYKFGKNALMLAAEGIKKEWRMRSGARSPRYTTHWQEIAQVY